MISKFLFNFCNFCVISYFVTKLLILGILFSTAVNAAFVAKPLILGILPSISVILALQSVFLTRPLVSGTFFSNSVLCVSYLVFKTNALVSMLFALATIFHIQFFLTTSFFTTSLNLPKSTETGTNSSIFNLSNSIFKLAKFDFNAINELSICEISLIYVFVA